MKITTIGYQHTFRCSEFLYDKIYMEATLEPNDTEEQVVSELIEKCKKVASQVSGANYVLMQDVLPMSSAEIDDRLAKIMPPLEESLRQCTSTKELELYFKIIDKKPEGEEKRKLWLVYDEQYSKLSNQTV